MRYETRTITQCLNNKIKKLNKLLGTLTMECETRIITVCE